MNSSRFQRYQEQNCFFKSTYVSNLGLCLCFWIIYQFMYGIFNYLFTSLLQIGGVELDICDLDRTIQECGGMRHEVEKKKWARVADTMNVPKMVGYIVKLFLRIILLNKHVTWIKPFRLNYLSCNLYQMLL